MLPANPRDWPEDALDLLAERVAIMVHDGGLDEAEAKRQAVECTRRHYQQYEEAS